MNKLLGWFVPGFTQRSLKMGANDWVIESFIKIRDMLQDEKEFNTLTKERKRHCKDNGMNKSIYKQTQSL